MVAERRKWLIAGIVLLLVAAGIFVLWPGEAARIKKQFDSLAGNIQKKAGENQLAAAANARRVREVFTEMVSLYAPAYDYDRELPAAEIPALVLSARMAYTELSLDFDDYQIEILPDNLALVRVTSRLRGQLTSGEAIEDFQELNCQLQKISGSWRFRAVEVIEVLTR